MKKILIYNSGGGLGDSIQLFPLLISLKYFIITIGEYGITSTQEDKIKKFYLLNLLKYKY